MKTTPYTVIFSTCNRKDMLVHALDAVLEKWKPDEVIVADDASSDGTGELLREVYPDVRHICPDKNIGPAAIRNLGIMASRNDVVIGLDDDTIVQSDETVQSVFDALKNESIGALALPFANVLQSPEVHCMAPDGKENWVTFSFVAAAYALRRSCFEKYGPFRTIIRFMNEEDDLTLRFLDNGIFTGMVKTDIVQHMQSAARNTRFADIFGRRNDILFHAYNAPGHQVLLNLLGTMYKGLVFGARNGRLLRTLHGYYLGFSSLAGTLKNERKPVSNCSYKLYNRLKRHGPMPLSEAQEVLKSEINNI